MRVTIILTFSSIFYWYLALIRVEIIYRCRYRLGRPRRYLCDLNIIHRVNGDMSENKIVILGANFK